MDVQSQPGVHERRDDLGESVVEAHHVRRRERFVVIDIAVRRREVRAFGLEVRMLDDQQIVRAGVGQRPQQRVALANEEAPTGSEEGCDDLGPAPDVGQPAERADARCRRDRNVPRPRTSTACVEIDCRRSRSRRRSQQRVEQRPQAPGREKSRPVTVWRRGGRATGCRCRCGTGGAPRRGLRCAEPGQIEADDTGQMLRVLAEQLESVARDVLWHAAVPVGQIHRQVVTHAQILTRAARMSTLDFVDCAALSYYGVLLELPDPGCRSRVCVLAQWRGTGEPKQIV